VCDLAKKNGFLVFIDLAYQGLGEGIDEDAFGPRLMAEQLEEMIVVSSCSKNFGLYRERTGSLCVLTRNAVNATAVVTHLNKIVRGMYSMPPAHGATIVETLLDDPQLKAQWIAEVADVRARLKSLRQSFADAMQRRLGDDHFRFIQNQHGMFSFLGLTAEQGAQLQRDFSIYAAGSSRINVAGLSVNNVDYVAEGVAAVLG